MEIDESIAEIIISFLSSLKEDGGDIELLGFDNGIVKNQRMSHWNKPLILTFGCVPQKHPNRFHYCDMNDCFVTRWTHWQKLVSFIN